MSTSADNKTPQQGTSPTSATPQAAAVAVKPPPFDETSVTRWFIILESQFALANISVSSTKFHHVLANLPVRIINQLDDTVVTSQDFDKLKQALLTLFTKSKPELFDSLVNQNNIMCDKPSTYLREIQRIGQQLGVDNEFLKLKFLKTLPNNIRPIVVAHDDGTSSLEELARVADTMLAFNVPSTNTSSVNTTQVNNANRGPNANVKVKGNYNVQNKGDSTYSKMNVPEGVRAFPDGQRPQVCRYHLYYGSKARSCKRWCILSSTSHNVLPSSRPPSRSSSPAPKSDLNLNQ